MIFYRTRRKRLGVSPVVAILLLIAIAVAAATVMYAFVTGLIGGLDTSDASALVQITGGLTVPTGSGAGTLVLDVKNTGSNPITGITVSVDSADAITGDAYTAATSFPNATPFYVYGPGASLPIGQSVGSEATFQATSGIQAGHTYSFTVTVDFTPGISAQVQDISLTAEA
jgi:flagellin-like protein